MAHTEPTNTERRWREEPASEPGRLGGPSRRQRRLLLLAALSLAVGGALAAVAHWIAPPPRPYFVPLWVTEYRWPSLPTNLAAERDRRALRDGGYFPNVSGSAVGTLERHRLLQELAALEQRSADDSIVVYLSAFADGSEQGQLSLLPADFSPLEPRSRLPLRDVLTCLKRCPARHKLLVLDLMWPTVNPRLGFLINDAAALVEAELNELNDPHLLVLSAASAWQTSLVSPELQRSLFGYYFEQGLRGFAEGWGPEGLADGRIHVRELVSYLQDRVDAWAWHNRGLRQTPRLFGCGSDFELVAMRHGGPARPLRPAPWRKYPAWLHDAWKLRDEWLAGDLLKPSPRLIGKLEDEIRLAEQTWALGEEERRVKEDLAGRIAELSRLMETARREVAGPAPRSLGMLRRQGLTVNSKIEAALDELLGKLAAQTAGVPPQAAAAARQKLMAQFQEQAASVPPAELAAACVNRLVSLANPKPDDVKLLDGILSGHQPQPRYVETLFLRRLTALADQVPAEAWPAGLVRLAAHVVGKGEAACGFPGELAGIGAVLERAAGERHLAELLLLHPGFSSWNEAERRLLAASAAYDELLGIEQAADEAGRTLRTAQWLLGNTPALADADAGLHGAWLAVAAAATDLADALPAASRGSLDLAALERVREKSSLLERCVVELKQPLESENVQRLIARCQRPDATGLVYREAADLLKAPSLAASDRAALAQAVYDLGYKLAWRTHNRELAAPQEPLATRLELYTGEEQKLREHERALARARRALALLKVAGLPATVPSWLTASAGSAEVPKDGLSLLSATLRKSWLEDVPRKLAAAEDLTEQDRLARFVPPRAAALKLDNLAANPCLALCRRHAMTRWHWLADWYRYLSRDDADGSNFYAEAAADYADAAGPSAETWVEFDSPRLASPPVDDDRRVVIEIPWRAAGPHASGISASVRVLAPDLSPWQVHSETSSLKCGETLRLSVTSQPGAASVVPARGCLVRLKLGQRAFHLPVALTELGSLREWDVALSPNTQAADPLWEALRLRPLPSPQRLNLYVRNRAPAARTVTVQFPALAATSAKMTIAPGQWQRVAFAGTPPKENEPLPAMNGPLVVHVLDAESGRLLAKQAIAVDVASPREYVEVEQIRFQPTGLKPNRLWISARALPTLSPPPAMLELVLPAERIEGFQGAKAGVFRGKLEKAGQSISLFADSLQLTEGSGEQGYVYLNVDDCPRAFVFRCTLPRQGDATTPVEDLRPALRLKAPSLALAGPNLTVGLEVDQGPSGSKLEFELGSKAAAGFVAEQSSSYPSPKQCRVGFSPFGADGALLFSAAIGDWQPVLDATGIVGRRWLRARLIAADGHTICVAEQPITLDDTPPERVILVDPPQQVAKGTPLVLTATGSDELSGIAAATFFAGQPEEGKLPKDAPAAKGKPDDSGATWSASLELPPTAKGEITIGVQFTNGVGLSAIATAKVEVLDPAAMALGAIQGQVLEGPRPQAGLEVVLKDAKGTELAKTKTSDDGSFAFDKLQPGSYTLATSKPAAMRKAEASVKLEPGSTATATLRLQL